MVLATPGEDFGLRISDFRLRRAAPLVPFRGYLDFVAYPPNSCPLGTTGSGEAGLEPLDVGLDAVEILVGAGGIRVIEEPEEAAELVGQLGLHEILPEKGGLAHQVLRAGEAGDGTRVLRRVLGRFGKFLIKDGQLRDIIIGRYLPEEIGCAQGAPEDRVSNSLWKAIASRFALTPGAVDHVLDGPDVDRGESLSARSWAAKSALRPTWAAVYLAPVPWVSLRFLR